MYKQPKYDGNVLFGLQIDTSGVIEKINLEDFQGFKSNFEVFKRQKKWPSQNT